MPDAHPFAKTTGEGQVHLRIIATTDLHAHVFPYDYFADAPSDTIGLARTASLITAARAGAANSVLLDNGDFLQGNPLGDLAALPGAAGPHPVIAAMNVLGYDAATLGNHEFNYGLPFLLGALAEARFPVVCANVVTCPGATPAEDATLLPASVILDRQVTDGAGQPHLLRLGVIGFVPPQIMQWDAALLTGQVTTRDIVACAAARVPGLKAAGADVIVALSHSGIGAAMASTGMENAAVPLAQVPGIDAVVAGHSHLVFPSSAFDGLLGIDVQQGTISGKPAVMAGCFGSHLGVIDLALDRGAGGWRVRAFTAEARPIARRSDGRAAEPLVPDAAPVLAAAQDWHAATLDHVRRPVGHSAVPLHSFFALVADDPALQLVADAQAAHVAAVLAGTPHGALPLLSAAAPFKAGGRGGPEYYTDVPAGPLALRHVADLYLYPNSISALRVTGAALQEWLERAAAAYLTVRPGVADQPLLNAAFPAANFDVISGVTYRIDLSQPPRYDPAGAMIDPGRSRIRDLCHNGVPVTPDQCFIVATNSYRSSGDAALVYQAPDTNRDILRRHIAAQGVVAPRPRGTWRFAPLPGTSAVFDTSPRALPHLAALQGVDIVPAGMAPGGFARFRIRL